MNNAGVLHIGTAEQITEEQWDQTFNVNVRGLWMLSRAVLPLHAEGGRRVNCERGVCAGHQRRALARGLRGVEGRRRAAHQVHGHRSWPEKIRVNAICPSFVETDLTAEVIRKAPDPNAVRKERIAVHPIGRLGEPEDIAGLAVYLASDESSWVTGAAMPVDGGYLAV